MKNPIFLSFLIIIICICQVSGMTVVNSRFSGSMNPGGATSFEMVMKSDNLAEKGMPIVITTDGNCSQWIKTDSNTIQLTPGGVPVAASVNIPKTAYNGFYQCTVQYTAPPSGMIQSRIEVPIKLTISGGKDAPVPTFVSTTTTATPTITMNAPIEEQVIPLILPGIAQVRPVSGPAPQIPYLWIIGGVIAMAFVLVGIWDYRRGKR